MPDPKKAGFLSKKIGGVNVKWWALGGAGVAGGVYYYSKKSQAAALATQDNTVATQGTGSTDSADSADGTDYDSEDYDSGDYGDEGFVEPTTADGSLYDPDSFATESAPVDVTVKSANTASNVSWLHKAEEDLKGRGYSAATVRAALTAYLTGAPISEKQEGIVQSAIQQVGTPPNKPSTIHVDKSIKEPVSKAQHRAKVVAKKAVAKDKITPAPRSKSS